jgi:hypothetical protein
MKKEKEIQKGSIVSVKENVLDKNGKVIPKGFMQVTSIRGGKVNLGGIMNGKIYHKGIPIECVYESSAEWWDRYSKSESYMSM